jgi:hypothetical protein
MLLGLELILSLLHPADKAVVILCLWGILAFILEVVHDPDIHYTYIWVKD